MSGLYVLEALRALRLVFKAKPGSMFGETNPELVSRSI